MFVCVSHLRFAAVAASAAASTSEAFHAVKRAYFILHTHYMRTYDEDAAFGGGGAMAL